MSASMDNASLQLSLDETRNVRWRLGGALAILALATAFSLGIGVEWWAVIAAGLVSIFTLLPSWAAWLPRRAGAITFPFLVLGLICDIYLEREILAPMIRLDLALIVFRFATLRGRRDDLQLVVLTLFLIVVAGVLSTSVFFGVQIVVFTGVALVFLFLVTISGDDAQDIQGDAAPLWTRLTVRALARRLWAVADWRVLAVAVALFVGTIFLSGLLFLAIPRVQMPNSIFFDRLVTRKSRSGFTDHITFGGITDLQQDNTRVLAVTPPQSEPIDQNLYWRMLVMDEYTGDGFRLSPGLSQKIQKAMQPSAIELSGGGVRRGEEWTFYFEDGFSHYLPVIGDFSWLRLAVPQPAASEPNLRIVSLGREPLKMTAYRVRTSGVNDALFDRMLAKEFAAALQTGTTSYPVTLLALPKKSTDGALLRETASAIGTGSKPNAVDFAERASAWLQSRHRYGTKLNVPEGEGDVLVRWMNSTLPGHCEFFSGALTLLCRAAGYPTRVVAGFRGATWNGFENYYMVTNANVHAWCEVFDGKGHWVRIDPTPQLGGAASTLTPAAVRRTTDRSWAARIDSLEVIWYRHVVSFDQRSQSELVTAVQSTFEQAWKFDARAFGSRFRAWIKRPWPVVRLARWLTVLVVFGFSVLGFRWIRRRPQHRSLWPVVDRHVVRTKAGRFIVRLRRANASGPENVALMAELERLRFGRQITWSDPAVTFRHARQALRKSPRVGPV